MGSLLLSIILLVAIVGVGTARKDLYKEGSHSSEAIFKLPNSSIEVVLERRNIHLFLPEYERTLVLRVNGTEVHRLGAAVDTGGYSRMNVHRKSSHEYFLSGELSFDRYLFDTSKISLTKTTEAEIQEDATFVGCFDRDEKGWRFIPAIERRKQ